MRPRDVVDDVLGYAIVFIAFAVYDVLGVVPAFRKKTLRWAHAYLKSQEAR